MYHKVARRGKYLSVRGESRFRSSPFNPAARAPHEVSPAPGRPPLILSATVPIRPTPPFSPVHLKKNLRSRQCRPASSLPSQHAAAAIRIHRRTCVLASSLPSAAQPNFSSSSSTTMAWIFGDCTPMTCVLAKKASNSQEGCGGLHRGQDLIALQISNRSILNGIL